MPSVNVMEHPEPEGSREGIHDQRDSPLKMPSCKETRNHTEIHESTNVLMTHEKQAISMSG